MCRIAKLRECVRLSRFNPGGWRDGMEGDLDCDSFRAGLIHLQGCRKRVWEKVWCGWRPYLGTGTRYLVGWLE